jgi:L-asparaginase/Glu-tRNA(Gln) amidotransferase subunit D
MIKAARETNLKGLILQLYGTGNMPSLKDDLVNALAEANNAGVCVVVTTQCHTGSGKEVFPDLLESSSAI